MYISFWHLIESLNPQTDVTEKMSRDKKTNSVKGFERHTDLLSQKRDSFFVNTFDWLIKTNWFISHLHLRNTVECSKQIISDESVFNVEHILNYCSNLFGRIESGALCLFHLA